MAPSVVFLKRHAKAPGGLEKIANLLQKAFAAEGCKTMRFCGKKRALSFLDLYHFDKECQKWLFQNKSDIVFGLDRNTFQTHYRAGNGVHQAYLERRKRQENILKSISFTLNPLHRLILQYEKQAFEDPQLRVLFTNSEMVKQEILHYYKVKQEKIHVVHNGVEWQEWQSAFDATPFSSKWGLELLFVGNGFKRKGLLLLLEAMALAKKEMHLTVVGKDREQKFFEHVAKELRLQVTFVGPQKSVLPFYQKADVFVLPSLYDPFSNATLEAAAMGLSVITTHSNGASEIIQHGQILSTYNPEELALAIDKAPQKTKERATLIRESVKSLDFAHQLHKMVSLSLQYA